MLFEHQKTNDILNWFEQINQFPRCSNNEQALSQWLINWAESNNFSAATDKVQNLLIKVPASLGYENSPIVVLQGHLDMVCEKTPDSNHDFTKDPIKHIYDGEWLTADKTTLGADNGIAIAMAMTLAMDKTVAHPPLELLFTVDEETGLNGASGLDPELFDGRILINIDSEDEGILTVGCAGGINTNISLPIEQATAPSDYQLIKIKASGMSGGHSGIDINDQKANAIKLLAHTIFMIAQQVDVRLTQLNGGTAHNVIPRDAEATLWASKNDIETVNKIVSATENTLKNEYKNTDPHLSIQISAADLETDLALTSQDSQKVIDFILAIPHGVAAMFTEIENLVETSSNLAIVNIENGQLKILTSQRSSVESRIEALTYRIEALARLAGGEAYSDNRYPAWQPNMSSELLTKSLQIYENLFTDKKPTVEILHAGLECGIIGNKVQGMDMISVGPTIKYPHSPNEKIHIASIGRVWDFLQALLKSLK
jgi:dipeptidase D